MLERKKFITRQHCMMKAIPERKLWDVFSVSLAICFEDVVCFLRSDLVQNISRGKKDCYYRKL